MAKVLVVDDDELFATLMVHALKGKGHEVELALDGQAGEAAFEAGSFDCVVCDLVMPRQEGLETIRFMRKSKPQTAIVAVSGGLGPKAGIDVLKVAEQFGAHVCVRKPLQFPELCDAVDTALARAAATRQNAVRA
jgi:DNA-binding response OmpR family regulator